MRLWAISTLLWPSLCFSSVLELRATHKCNQDNVLRAMEHRTPDSYSFCSDYISQTPSLSTTTVTKSINVTVSVTATGTIRPISYYSLERWSSTQTPITYTNQNVPTPVPGGAQYYSGQNLKRDSETDTLTTASIAAAAATAATTTDVPSYLATVPASRISSGCSCLLSRTVTQTTTFISTTRTTVCTSYTTASTTSYPAFCAPSAQVNYPRINFWPPTWEGQSVQRTVPNNKLECCALCASTFNCLWWHYQSQKDFPNSWDPGDCTIGYHYGFNTSFLNEDVPNVCPNGIADIIGFSYMPVWGPPTPGWQGDPSTSPDPLALGYNQGPCGNPYQVFDEYFDPGYPDPDDAGYCDAN